MKIIITLVMLLLSTSPAFAAGNVKLYSDLEFSDKSVQQKAYNLPTCASGEVYVNKSGSLFCGSLMPIDKGIAICISGACSLSACMQGFGDCDGNLSNGCEATVGTIQNCSCGISCTPANECVTPACINGACQFTFKAAGTPTQFFTPGTCHKTVCDGAGNIINVIENTNVPGDNNECTIDLCVAGVPANVFSPAGAFCTGGACNGSGQCIPIPVCGNGIVEAGEQCDDGNTTNGDGCSSTCKIESGYYCSGTPNVCSTICGDGFRAGAEQCDDGNFANGDGCSNTCLLEPPILFVNGFPSPIPSGVPGGITVTAKNANGLTSSGYTGTVHFTSSDPGATLPANYAFTSMDGGVHVFGGIKLVTAGNQSITVTDSNNASVTGTQNINVAP